MSKMGNWVVEMQEDAEDMTLSEFIKQHGSTQASIWHEVQQEMDTLSPNEYWGSRSMEMDDGA